jgi:hypothetical protein
VIEDRGVMHYVIHFSDGRKKESGYAENRGKGREVLMQTLARHFVDPATQAIYVEVRDG